MAAEAFVLVVLTFFQIAGALFLFRRGGPERRTLRILSALLVLNAVLSSIEALRAGGLPYFASRYAIRLIDLPSAALILAVAVSRTRVPHAARWTGGVLAAGALQVVAGVAFPQLVTVNDHWALFQAVPYYVCSAVLIAWSAFGDWWERWVALAFLPRAVYVAVPHVADLLVGGGWAQGVALAVQVGVLVLFAGCVVGVVALVLRPLGAPPAAVLAVVSVGPLLAASELAFVDAPRGALVVHDWISLGLVRPLFLYVGLCRGDVPAILARTFTCSGAAWAGASGLQAVLAFPPLSAWLIGGIGSGLLAFALLDTFLPSGGPLARRARRVRVVAPGRAVAEVQGEDRDARAKAGPEPPHWQRLLVELRGSSAQREIGESCWTQKALARRTGISVKRVSEFPQMLNATAGQKLSAHLPAWESQRDAPPLVEAHKGAVRGASGVWVYYRLTPAGEELAEHVSAQLASAAELRPESGRNPLLPS